MPESAAVIVALGLTAYAVAGVTLAVPFVMRGVNAIDSRAAGAGPGFRLLIVPGAIVFWPLLLRRWMGSR